MFELGDITVDRLISEAKNCHGAIFVFARDDDITSRDVTSKITRDNVIFEAGVFTSVLGIKRSIIFAEEGTKILSDLSGVTLKTFSSEFQNIDPLVSHFKSQLANATARPNAGEVPIYQDGDLTKKLLDSDPYPKDWIQRLVYIGHKGAKNWLNVAQGSDYSSRTVAYKTRQAIKEAVNRVEEAKMLISFGPGDGTLDQELITVLSTRIGSVSYIPVDINIEFTKRAIMQMPASVHVPLGIVADFEERMGYALDQALPHRNGRTIFSLLGYTLANLDRSESVFITGVKEHMKVGDYLLLDLSIQGPDWSEDREKVMKPAEYSDAYKKLLATGITRRRNECFNQVLHDFNTRIVCHQTDRSEIENSKILLVTDGQSGLELFKFTRYDYPSFKRWLVSMGFEIVFDKPTERDRVADFAVVLARKK